MAGGKLSPRQKMINMMYLVLMALLALNVSKEILKSFHLMEVSFNRAKENLDGKIDLQMKSFSKQAGNDPTLQPYYQRAMDAQRITDDFVNYIEEIKMKLEEETGGRKDPEEGEDVTKTYETELVGMDNMEVHANYFMVDNNNGANKKGYQGVELEKRVNDTRAQLLDLLKADKAKGIEIDANKAKAVADACQLSAVLTEVEAKKYPSWSAKYLEHSPLAGVITMLTKMQSDAKATQGAVLDVLNQGDVQEYNVEALVPIVRPVNGGVIMRGGTYKAEVFLAAQIKGGENDEYSIAGDVLKKEGGKAIYEAAGGTPGTYEFKGVVKVKTPKGIETYDFEDSYQVFEGGATISATKMNVLYIGVKNDISVGVPGVNPNDVTVSMTGGRISKVGKNKYVATCTNRGKAIISASAKMSDGSTRRVGSAEYRVKKLPKPIGMWGGIASGTPSPKPALLAQRAVIASMGEGFVLDGISYKVQSFQFVHAPKRGEAFITKGRGQAISGAMHGAIRRAKRGDRIIVDQIRAVGPGGKVTLQPIMIEII
ncbi:MAG: gliding motility protein GldM [Bacteroidia bacterium]|nr:gliding motility protein GldM [Bacteroidia bacterium]